MKLHSRMQTVAVAVLLVAFVFGSTRAVNAQIMFRGFAAGSQAACPSGDGPGKREFLAGGDIGGHTRYVELTFGGVASSCPDIKVLGNFGIVIFPIHVGRFYAGGGAHYDFNDPNVRGFLRPEAVIGFTLKHDLRSTRDSSGDLIRQDLDGFAIDVRLGRYQDRAWYVAGGIAYYFNVWWKE